MKRLLAFITVFFTVLVIGYLQPVFFPAEKEQPKIQSSGRDTAHNALPYEKISTSGYAVYVGGKTSDFIEKFGEPKEKKVTNFDYELWIYGTQDSDYLEVNVRSERILAIKAFNETEHTKPFNLDMTLSEVSELTTIYSNFAFTYESQKYDIELTEEDMNYRPLIAFDNDTFAILFFNQGSGELTATVYLNDEMLLTLMPYQLYEGEPLSVQVIKSDESLNSEKSQQLIRVINLIKMREGLPSYYVNTESQKNAKMLYELLQKEQKSIISSDRLENWNQSQQENLATVSFTLTNEEYQKLLKISPIDQRKATGIFTEPVFDPSFTALYWFSDSLYHSRFAHQENENIGVAFSKESVLVLLQEAENKKTQTTEESE